jgi:hypothetical protein
VTGGTAGYGIAADPATANVFVTGQATNGFFISAYGPTGGALWSKTYGHMGDAGYGIAVDGGGNLALTGACGSVDWLGNYIYSTGAGYFVASFTTAGAYRWNVQASAGQSYGYGVAFDPLGHVLTGGSFYDTVDFGGLSATTGAGIFNAFIAQYTK